MPDQTPTPVPHCSKPLCDCQATPPPREAPREVLSAEEVAGIAARAQGNLGSPNLSMDSLSRLCASHEALRAKNEDLRKVLTASEEWSEGDYQAALEASQTRTQRLREENASLRAEVEAAQSKLQWHDEMLGLLREAAEYIPDYISTGCDIANLLIILSGEAEHIVQECGCEIWRSDGDGVIRQTWCKPHGEAEIVATIADAAARQALAGGASDAV